MTKRDLFCLTNEELNNLKYPNLIAEVRETTYSICTIADHMGLPKPYRKEDDAETWDKLTGMLKDKLVLLARACGEELTEEEQDMGADYTEIVMLQTRVAMGLPN